MGQTEVIKDLELKIAQLEEENRQLLARNYQLSEQLCMGYELRQRVDWLKQEMLDNERLMKRADLADDSELFAVIETKLEQDLTLLSPGLDSEGLAALVGVSHARLTKLFKRMGFYKSADDYLDNLRLMRAMRLLREHPQYGIAAVSEEAGFNSVRTFQRRMSEVVGMTPVEFRMMVEKKG